MSLVTEMYHDGYSEGKKEGQLELLDDLMKVVIEWKSSSEVISCSTLMQLLESRKNSIE